jgi:hypothetical protein
MADITKKTKPSADKCCGCGCALGDKPKIHPVSVSAADGSDPEVWCPRCFVYKRSPMEPGRWQNIDALMCMACDHETLGMGKPNCGNCGARTTVLCPPTRAVA